MAKATATQKQIKIPDGKFVRISEGRNVYYGVITDRDEENLTLIGVEVDKDSEILTYNLEIEDCEEIAERPSQDIESWFRTALIHSEKKVHDAEFEIKFAHENLSRRQNAAERALGRPLKT